MITVICAWCQEVIRSVHEPDHDDTDEMLVSHGICGGCYAEMAMDAGRYPDDDTD